MEFNNWYRTKIESNQEEPSGVVWDSLQDDLDLDLVWGRLESNLDQQHQNKTWLFLRMAASIALLIALGTGLFKPVNLNDYSPAEMGLQIPQTPFDNHSSSIALREISPVEAIPGQGDPQENSGASPFPILPGIPNSLSNNPSTAEHLIAMEGKPATISHDVLISHPVKKLNFPKGTSIQLMALETSGRPQFSVGIVGQYANTWQLNSKTIRGMRSTELTNTHASFGNNFGLAANALITPRTGFRAEFQFISQSRQNYEEYIGGKYTATALELDYTLLSLMMTRRLGSIQSAHWVTGGFYTAILQQARMLTGETINNVNEQYSNADIGLIAGYEYHIPLLDQIYLGAGLFARYGLSNAFSGTQQIPDYMNRTQNAAFIFSLSVNYSIK